MNLQPRAAREAEEVLIILVERSEKLRDHCEPRVEREAKEVLMNLYIRAKREAEGSL